MKRVVDEQDVGEGQEDSGSGHGSPSAKAIGDWTTEERSEVCETDEQAVVGRGLCLGEVMPVDQAEGVEGEDDVKCEALQGNGKAGD